MNNKNVSALIDEQAVAEVADELWENPELSLRETRSSDVLVDRLRSEGFTVEREVGDLPTGFLARYGTDGPAIGIIAEYDALPGFSQKRKPAEESLEAGAPGHACGHNLFAAGSVNGAIAVKEVIESEGLEGSILLYGCPAEEVLVGKTFMAREGVFDDLDAALSWHAGDLTWARMDSSRALDSLYLKFHGTKAHTRAPARGRSALDAIQLLNTGVEYMREHIPREVNISYTITNGGSNPGTVPAEASVWYYVRGLNRDQIEPVTDWVIDIAEAAGKMTQTDPEHRYLSGCHRTIHNRTLANVIQDNLERAAPIEHSREEIQLAADIRETIPEQKARSRIAGETVGLSESQRERILEQPVYPDPLESFNEDRHSSASTDIGDVSQIVPLGRFRAATWPVGVAPHTWQATAASGTLGKAGAVFAAKVLAGAAVDLLEEPETLREVREEFDREVGSDQYTAPIPEDTEPPIDLLEVLLNR